MLDGRNARLALFGATFFYLFAAIWIPLSGSAGPAGDHKASRKSALQKGSVVSVSGPASDVGAAILS